MPRPGRRSCSRARCRCATARAGGGGADHVLRRCPRSAEEARKRGGARGAGRRLTRLLRGAGTGRLGRRTASGMAAAAGAPAGPGGAARGGRQRTGDELQPARLRAGDRSSTSSTAGRSHRGVAASDLCYWAALAVGDLRPHPPPPRARTRLRRAFALLLDMGFLSWFLHSGRRGGLAPSSWSISGSSSATASASAVRWLAGGHRRVRRRLRRGGADDALLAGAAASLGRAADRPLRARPLRRRPDPQAVRTPASRRSRRARPRACSWPASATSCARRSTPSSAWAACCAKPRWTASRRRWRAPWTAPPSPCSP